MRVAESTKVGGAVPAAEKRDLPEVTIGKDVLEMVSSAMYIDPMTVYREYIQNSADAVDAARAAGALTPVDPGQVNISVDAAMRTVRIRDNGCGVPAGDFGHTLTSVGGSAKRGTLARGFRGVGRLAGLAYAQELVFRSRCFGETNISELRWDCRQLKAGLRDASNVIGVVDLIRSVTNLEQVELDNAPNHFFEVEMRGVVRLRDDRLVSPLAISNYLSQVAPVPFAPTFGFGSQLSESLGKYVSLGDLDIRINDADEPIYRPHRDHVSWNDKSGLKFDELVYIEVPSIDNAVAAIAWILHHDYKGALPTGSLVKGLRLRTGNIQVGGHTVLEDVFPEARFNSWSVGEVHVVDPRVVPNGRRDQFEQNVHFANLINHLAPLARDIAQRCRTSSIRRKHMRDFELCAEQAAEAVSIIRQGSAGRPAQEQLALSVERTLLRMSKIAGNDVVADIAVCLEERTEDLRRQLSEAMKDDTEVTSPLMRLPAAKRAWYEHFFELIYECSPNRTTARALIDRILLRID